MSREIQIPYLLTRSMPPLCLAVLGIFLAVTVAAKVFAAGDAPAASPETVESRSRIPSVADEKTNPGTPREMFKKPGASRPFPPGPNNAKTQSVAPDHVAAMAQGEQPSMPADTLNLPEQAPRKEHVPQVPPSMDGGVMTGAQGTSRSLSNAPLPEPVDSEAVPRLVNDNNRFALSLYSKLAGPQGNLFFSPYSISTALAMTYAGARGNTASQMEETLHFTFGQERLHPAFAALVQQVERTERKGISLTVANALWPQEGYPLREDYLTLVGGYYGGLVRSVDYVNGTDAARLTINGWVEERTQNKIRELLGPANVSSATRIILVNAIYFKGQWNQPFDKKHTKDMAFHLTPERSVSVPMMLRWVDCRHASFSELDIVELPYVSNHLSMVILLPKEIDGIRGIEGKLTHENLSAWLDNLQHREVIVYLPKFTTSSRFVLGDTLSLMGMPDAFDERANFSGISEREGFFIGEVVHQAFVEVNEQGTEAAAATAVAGKQSAVLSVHRPPTFLADHPFIFLIRENRTGSILFAGRMAEPSMTGKELADSPPR